MSIKSRLFASVAAPLVSLPLLMQPAAAMPAATPHYSSSDVAATQGDRPVILAQAAPDDGQGEEPPLKPKRQKGQDQGQEKPQGQPPTASDQRDRPARPPKADKGADAPDQKPQRPRAGDAETQPATPRRAQPADQQPEAPAARPQQNNSDREPLPRDRKPKPAPDAQEPAAREPRPADNGKQPPRNAATPDQATPGEKPQPPKPGKDRPAAPDATPERPARAATPGTPAPADNAAPDAARPAAPDAARPAAPDATRPVAPDATRQPAPDATRPVAPDGQARPPRPARDPNAQQPGDVRPGDNRTEQGQPQGERPRRLGADGQPLPDSQPPLDGRPPRDQAGQPRPAPDQQPGQPAVATTPQQVDRARELARDPNSARRGEQQTLPVENGAAVFDSDKQPGDSDRPRRPRPQQQADDRPLGPPPRTDADAQQSTRMSREQRAQFRELNEARGERLDRRPDFERPQGWEFDGPARRPGGRDDGRVIISIDNQPVVRHDDSRRFYDRDGRQPEYDRLSDDRYREVIVRDDGTRVVTIRNRYGEIVQRTRVVRGGQEYVLYEAPELMDNGRRGENYVWRDPGEDLPPMRLNVPLDRYIIDTTSEPDRDYYEFLEQPPVEPVERVYSVDEVRYSARIRDKVPRIDLDTVTFATGSAEIPMNQASSLRKVADAINKVLQKDPSETFLIEGHTDAVGSDQDNLVLSDQRAESVARVLTDAFNIPPENLTTQGYGEQYLKVRVDGPNQENRRVTIRRITALVKPVASNQ